MKNKIIAVLLTVLIFSSTVICAGATYQDEELKFNSSGKFKIMVLSDVQDDYPVNEDTMAFIDEALEAEQPDLVVFNGDNIVTSDTRAYGQLLKPLVNRNVKFTFVFGNHDDESSVLTKEEILAEFQKYEGCVAYDAVPELHGCATHNLPIKSSDGKKVAFNLWLFDSGDYSVYQNGERGYDCVRYDQIKWYEEVSKTLEKENGGLVPSIAFQHIIPIEPVKNIYFEFPFSINKITFDFNDGSHYLMLPKFSKIKEGFILEHCCPSMDNEGQWAAMAYRKDVLALVTGHDHINSFTTTCDGIDLVQTPGITSHSYSRSFIKGAEIITLDEKNPKTYESHTLYQWELALRNNSTIQGSSQFGTVKYFFAKVLYKICNFGLNILLGNLK